MAPHRRILRLFIGIAIASSLVASGLLVGSRVGELGARAPLAGAPGVTAGGDIESLDLLAIDLAAGSRALPVRDGDFDDRSRYCDPNRMHVIWVKPGESFLYGAYIEPLGPPPGPTTSSVNGIVVCEGSSYAYMGFEAIRGADGWDVIPVPDIGGHDDESNDHETPADDIDTGLVGKATPPAATVATGPPPSPAKALTAAIEPYAGYVAQSTCSPGAKPGVLAFRKVVLAANPGTRSLGITRGCSVGGRSEHKEGRAWDWGVNVNRPAERAKAEALIDWLFATDEFGNAHAMARRLGVMYIVWNRQIWGAYRVGQGWRPYNGASPHTDHIHFSFAWPGAEGKTSFWTGVPAEMPDGSGGGGGTFVSLRGGSGRGGEGKPAGTRRWGDGTRTRPSGDDVRWQHDGTPRFREPRDGDWWRDGRRPKDPTPEPEPDGEPQEEPATPEPSATPTESGSPPGTTTEPTFKDGRTDRVDDGSRGKRPRRKRERRPRKKKRPRTRGERTFRGDSTRSRTAR